MHNHKIYHLIKKYFNWCIEILFKDKTELVHAEIGAITNKINLLGGGPGGGRKPVGGGGGGGPPGGGGAPGGGGLM